VLTICRGRSEALTSGSKWYEINQLLNQLEDIRTLKESLVKRINSFNKRDITSELKEIDELRHKITMTLEDRQKVIDILNELATEEEMIESDQGGR